MTIETKFNLGDVVCLLKGEKVHFVQIIKINIQYGNHINCVNNDQCKGFTRTTPMQYVSYRVKYASGGEEEFGEERLFATKEELLQTL
jgi:hypothetical protein